MCQQSKRLSLALAAVVFFGGTFGCATYKTVADLDRRSGSLVYSGTRLDAVNIVRPLMPDERSEYWIFVPFAIVDFPFSLIADTLLLPYTLTEEPKEKAACPTEPPKYSQ